MSFVFGSGVYGGGVLGGGPSGPTASPLLIPVATGLAATLAFDGNDLAVQVYIAKGDAAIEQKVRSRLRMWLGEWFLDTRLGVPYLQRVLVKSPNIPAIQGVFRRVIMSVRQIVNVQKLTVTYAKATRTGNVDFIAVLDDGRTLTATNEPFIVPYGLNQANP